MASSTPVILVIADISGYTEFMRMHSVVSSHAREITIRLLKTVIAGSAYPLRVAEIEGDAVFFYAAVKGGETAEVVDSVKRQIIGLFKAFGAEAARLEAMDVCSCEACSSVGTLALKQVVHFGEASIETVSRFEKLFSLDVILVHRLLKNSVEDRRYVLLTAPAYDAFEPFFGLTPEGGREELDGIGEVDVFVFHGDPLENLIDSQIEPHHTPTRLERFIWRMRLVWSEFQATSPRRSAPEKEAS